MESHELEEARDKSLKWLARLAEAQATTGVILAVGLVFGFFEALVIGIAAGFLISWICMLQAKLEADGLDGKWPLMWSAIVWTFLGTVLGVMYALLGIPMNVSLFGMCAIGCLLALVVRIEVWHWAFEGQRALEDEQTP